MFVLPLLMAYLPTLSLLLASSAAKFYRVHAILRISYYASVITHVNPGHFQRAAISTCPHKSAEVQLAVGIIIRCIFKNRRSHFSPVVLCGWWCLCCFVFSQPVLLHSFVPAAAVPIIMYFILATIYLQYRSFIPLAVPYNVHFASGRKFCAKHEKEIRRKKSKDPLLRFTVYCLLKYNPFHLFSWPFYYPFLKEKCAYSGAKEVISLFCKF